MTENVYRRSIQLLRENDIEIDEPVIIPSGSVKKMEERLGHRLPETYKLMLIEFGSLAYEGDEIYGLTSSGIDGDRVPNAVFATLTSRERGEITDRMVRIMASGYGPYFVIDCDKIDDQGRAPILEVHERGVEHGVKQVAADFSDFLRMR